MRLLRDRVDVQFSPEEAPIRVVMVANGAGNRAPVRSRFVYDLRNFGDVLNGRITEASAGYQGDQGQGDEAKYHGHREWLWSIQDHLLLGCLDDRTI